MQAAKIIGGTTATFSELWLIKPSKPTHISTTIKGQLCVAFSLNSCSLTKHVFLMVIYKYYSPSEKFFDALQGDYFWFSSPNDFNDPFDCYAQLIEFYSDDFLNKITQELPGVDASTINEVMHLTVEEQMRKYGICCFSQTPTNTLMWSHYASAHQGFCIGYDITDYLEDFKGYPVTYAEKLKSLNYHDDKDKAFNNLILTKSKDWAYEKEFRIFKEQKGAIKYNPEIVREVIFGWKSFKHQQRVIDVIKNKELTKNVTFYQSEPRSMSFDLSLNEVKM
jgi:hypothetical protein